MSLLSNRKVLVCSECGLARSVRYDNTAILCRSCTQKGERSPAWKGGISGRLGDEKHKVYIREQMRKLRAKWIAEGKHPELKRRNTRDRLRRFERMAGRNCPQLCEVCGNPQPDHLTGSHGGRVTHLCYDHSHKTGKFRGWICSPCNKCLGLIDDDIERLKKLILYLELTNE